MTAPSTLLASHHLAALTTNEVRALVSKPRTAILLPIGSVEPHGPHLPLATDTLISEASCFLAVSLLEARGITARIAPAISYGVTEFAADFPGAVGVPADVLAAFVRAVVDSLVRDGWSHVVVVNNHLEPKHDAAVRAAIADISSRRASVASPLTRKWGRTLSDEFKRGNCHAGRYETSLILAIDESLVAADRTNLPSIATSLSDEIRLGKTSFVEMGLTRAYTGTPSESTREEGEYLIGKLAEMIAGEVLD